MTDGKSMMASQQDDINEVVEQINREQKAFEMLVAGYRLRVEHETTQPSSLRDKDEFSQELRDVFWRVYDE